MSAIMPPETIARRFYLCVEKHTSHGTPYEHICYVAEFEHKSHAHLTDAQCRKKFRDKTRNIEAGNPTRTIKMEYIPEYRHG